MDLVDLARAAKRSAGPDPFIPHKMSAAEWVSLFEFLGLMKRCVGFYLGDAMIECERQMGERAAQLISATGLSGPEQEEYARVSERWETEYRLYSLPWSMHRDAGLDMDVAHELVKSAERMGWSRDQLRAAKKILDEAKGEDNA